MPIYTFRVTYEDDENIFRDVQIKPSQTVNDFNHAIVAAFKIKNDYTPSLYISNDVWKKVRSLTGVTMNGVAESANPKDKPSKKKKEETTQFKNPVDTSLKLVNVINDPHQLLVAEYEKGAAYTFHIELLSIDVTEDKKSVYPLCTKSVGPSPFQNDDLKKYLDNRSKGEEQEQYALDSEDDETDEMGVVSDTDEEVSEDVAIDPEIADEFGSTEDGFEESTPDE